MKRIFLSFAMVIFMFFVNVVGVDAAEKTMNPIHLDKNLIERLELESSDIISLEKLEIDDINLDEFVLAYDNNGIKENVSVSLQKMKMIKDNSIQEVYILTANSAEKYSKGSKNGLSATICWKDNFGPSNELIYVSGSYPGGGNKTYTYNYWVNGRIGSTQKPGSWTGNSFRVNESGYKGLSFSLHVMANGNSLLINTSISD